MTDNIRNALKDPATARLLRSVITSHVKVGGYPDTAAIARDAYELGRASAMTQDSNTRASEAVGRARLIALMREAFTEDRSDADGGWVGNLLEHGCAEAGYCDPADAEHALLTLAADAILAALPQDRAGDETATAAMVEAGEIECRLQHGARRVWAAMQAARPAPASVRADALEEAAWFLEAAAERVDPAGKKRVPMVDQHTASVLRANAIKIRALTAPTQGGE